MISAEWAHCANKGGTAGILVLFYEGLFLFLFWRDSDDNAGTV